MNPHFGSSTKMLRSCKMPPSPQSSLNSTSLPSAASTSKLFAVFKAWLSPGKPSAPVRSSWPKVTAQPRARVSIFGREPSFSVRAMNNASFERIAEKRARIMSSAHCAAFPFSTRSTAAALASPWSARTCAESTFFLLRCFAPGTGALPKPLPAPRDRGDVPLDCSINDLGASLSTCNGAGAPEKLWLPSGSHLAAAMSAARGAAATAARNARRGATKRGRARPALRKRSVRPMVAAIGDADT
mmetsp:Transcript_46798/g.100039  ORF Transcript_46798/g.100039 Transcript_46798/m.100039 type:complete len:243 (+) Transcript_46798:84-812(+)